MALDYERVDLNPFSWSSLVYTINGQEIFGVTGIACGWKRERSDGYGLSRSHAPRTMSAGKVSFEPLKLKVYADTLEAIRAYYAMFSADGITFTEPRLNHAVQYIESQTFADKRILLENVAWVTETDAHDEGPEALMSEIEFKPMRMSINGYKPWNSALR